jgi:hypothetical protein
MSFKPFYQEHDFFLHSIKKTYFTHTNLNKNDDLLEENKKKKT